MLYPFELRALRTAAVTEASLSQSSGKTVLSAQAGGAEHRRFLRQPEPRITVKALLLNPAFRRTPLTIAALDTQRRYRHPHRRFAELFRRHRR